VKIRAILFVLAFLVWCLLSWVPDWQHLLVGFFIAFFVAMMTADLFNATPRILKHPHRYWYFIVHYLPVFLWECLKANFDVAYRVIHPGLPMNPSWPIRSHLHPAR